MHLIDFVIFLAFTLGVVVFGCSFFKKGSSADEFTSAGHSIPGWVVGMSIFATYVSSISYIGYPGKAFASNWNAFVFSLSIPTNDRSRRFAAMPVVELPVKGSRIRAPLLVLASIARTTNANGFCVGCLPQVLSHGAMAGSRHTSVICLLSLSCFISS